jgi:hypothetical protein
MFIEKIAKLLVNVLPDRYAVRVVSALATRTQRPPLSQEQQQALDQAVRLRYGSDNQNVAWSWGSGPLVILVHGWNGRAGQLAPLALGISKLGFRCVAIEITGHGSSAGGRTAWECFIKDIAVLTRSLGHEVHAYVAHSAGGLATMAARDLQGIQADRYVCICAPSHPYPPINVIRKRLNPRLSVINRYRQYIADQFQSNWDALKSGTAYAGAGSEMLLFYDDGDRFVDHNDGDQIRNWCPGSRLIKSSGFGHSKVLASPELARAVAEFLTDDSVNNPDHTEQLVASAGLRGAVC